MVETLISEDRSFNDYFEDMEKKFPNANEQ